MAAVLLFTASVEAAPKKKRPGTAAPEEEAIVAPPTPLDCKAPDEVDTGATITIDCELERWLADARVELHFRAAGSESYRPVSMDLVGPKGPLRGQVPGVGVGAPFLLYYLQATIESAVVAASGRPDSPNIVRVRPAPPPPGLAGVLGRASMHGSARATASAGSRHGEPRAPGRFWVGLGLGSGYGWQSRSPLEYRSDLEADAGFGPAGILHLAPEVGYQLTPRIALALAGRHQFISSGGGEPAYPGQPARWAHALLARGLYFVDRGPLGFYGAAQIGGGDGFRFRFPPDPIAGRPRHDTTRAGPLVFGPGAGVVYRLRAQLSLVLDTSLLVGVPAFGLMGNVNFGVQVNL
jgi:hypothetical protein